MTETSNSEIVSTRQQRIAQLAKQAPQMAFISLNHHIDLAWLMEAYRRTRKDGAVGVDGRTARDYEADLEANLQSLLNRAKSGTYRAPPVRRVHIPKGTGNDTRPIGIPTFEDKVLQRAVAMVLEPIYEQDFHDGSYGFRPGRSPHQALQSLWDQTMQTGGGWILEVDIRKFFDTLDHAVLRELVRRRVRDGVLLRLIGKWLNAGVFEGGQITYPEAGSPQGGVISPMLANIYLHYVLDEWFVQDVRPRMNGRVFLVRYADDFVIGFTDESDARAVMDVLPKRFGKYGLMIHPEKTRLVPFQRPPRTIRKTDSKSDGPGTFDLLGFTHYWGLSRKGHWVVKKKTAKGRFTRALKAIYQWCKTNRHQPLAEQQRTLSQKMRGHYAYYGVTGNFYALTAFQSMVQRIWRKWLGRRTRDGQIAWVDFNRLLKRYPLPAAVVIHSVYGHAAKP
jgi:group II intron reverse transcriptase/maturase